MLKTQNKYIENIPYSILNTQNKYIDNIQYQIQCTNEPLNNKRELALHKHTNGHNVHAIYFPIQCRYDKRAINGLRPIRRP